MQNLLKKLALLMLIAGLPLQNLHAVSMPMCNQDQQSASAHAHSAQDGAQLGEMAEHDHADHQHNSSGADHACDGCSMCQVCSAPAVASVSAGVLLDSSHAPPPSLTTHASLFVPEQLQRPPLQS